MIIRCLSDTLSEEQDIGKRYAERSNEMVPNISNEKVAFERRQQLQREAEQQRMLASVRRPGYRLVRHSLGKFGELLMVLGIRLKQFELRDKQIMYDLQHRT